MGTHCSCYMGRDPRKPVFRVSDKGRLKPVSSAKETSRKIEISREASLDMILSKTRITKVLIRLRRCAGWSVPLLFANYRRQVFSRRGPYSHVILCRKYGFWFYWKAQKKHFAVRSKVVALLLLIYCNTPKKLEGYRFGVFRPHFFVHPEPYLSIRGFFWALKIYAKNYG